MVTAPGCWTVPIGDRSKVGCVPDVGFGVGLGLVPTTIGCWTCWPMAQQEPAWHNEIYLMIKASNAAMRSFRSLEPTTTVPGVKGELMSCGVPCCVWVVGAWTGAVATGFGVALTPLKHWVRQVI